MSQLQWQSDAGQWCVETIWITVFLLAVVYIPNFEWRKSLAGKGFCILSLGIIGALLRGVLMTWGVIHVRHGQYGFWNEFFIWFSIGSLALACAAFILLLIHTVKELLYDPEHLFFKLRKKHRKNDPAGRP